MKQIVIIILAMCGVLRAADTNTDIVINYKWEFQEMTFVSHIVEMQLYEAPKWIESQTNPPLPVRRAIASANEKLKEVVGKPDNFLFNRVSLSEPRRNHWLYEVNYLIVKPGEWSMSPKNISVFVLMDGRAILSKLHNPNEPQN